MNTFDLASINCNQGKVQRRELATVRLVSDENTDG